MSVCVCVCCISTNLSYKQVPHHLSGGVRHNLTLQKFDSRFLQHHTCEVTFITTCTEWSKRGSRLK